MGQTCPHPLPGLAPITSFSPALPHPLQTQPRTTTRITSSSIREVQQKVTLLRGYTFPQERSQPCLPAQWTLWRVHTLAKTETHAGL